MAMEGVKLLMSNDKMMTLIKIMTPAIIMMNYTVLQVGGAGCEGAAQLRVCVYRGGGKEARPKEHQAQQD